MGFDRDQCRHPILRDWLAGTSCSVFRVDRSIVFENDEFIVLKHNSHSSYVGGLCPNATCRAFADLYRKTDLALDARGFNENLFLGSGALMRWEGRVSTSAVREYCRERGIVFESPAHQPSEPGSRSYR